MALYAFDGTWNQEKVDSIENTNVVKFREAYTGRHKYLEGVGTRFGILGRIFGGLFGIGGVPRTKEMYKALIANWERGDRDIDVIGFSRGAALAVNFCNVVNELGIRSAKNPAQNPTIRFLGVWDVVGSFGIPINLVFNFQKVDVGYNLTVPANVQHCFHAMALDERRQTMGPTRLDASNQNDNIEELWFKGVHSDVGGGNRNIALSNISLKWMTEKGNESGLSFPADKLTSLDAAIDPSAPISENFDIIENDPRTVLGTDSRHPSAIASP